MPYSTADVDPVMAQPYLDAVGEALADGKLTGDEIKHLGRSSGCCASAPISTRELRPSWAAPPGLVTWASSSPPEFFEIQLAPAAVQAGHDGVFAAGPLAGSTVNVKFVRRCPRRYRHRPASVRLLPGAQWAAASAGCGGTAAVVDRSGVPVRRPAEGVMGEYRLFRQGGGRTGFAHVRVRVSDRTGTAPRVGWAVDPADNTSAQPARNGVEVEAALAGVEDALAALSDLGVDTANRVVEVVWAGMNIVDTDPAAMRAAACAATAFGFGAGNRFEVVFDNGWLCRIKAT